MQVQTPRLTHNPYRQSLGAAPAGIPASFNFLGPQWQTEAEMANNRPWQRAYIEKEQAAGRMPKSYAEGLAWIAAGKTFARPGSDGIPTYNGVKTWDGPIPLLDPVTYQPTGESIPQYQPYSTGTNQEFIPGGPVTATITLPLPASSPYTPAQQPQNQPQTNTPVVRQTLRPVNTISMAPQATTQPSSPSTIPAVTSSAYPQAETGSELPIPYLIGGLVLGYFLLKGIK